MLNLNSKTPQPKSVQLKNYTESEGRCACGCGVTPSDKCMIAHQAFHDSLERKYGRKIRHRITGGARCRPHNEALIARGEKAAKDSQHIVDPAKGRDCEALDGVWDIERRPGEWEQIPNEVIAQLAIKSGLFGGVGYKAYVPLKKNLVHLDVRMGGEIDIW